MFYIREIIRKVLVRILIKTQFYYHLFTECACKNGGVCFEIGNGKTGCMCLTGYYGRLCEKRDSTSWSRIDDTIP